MKFLIFSLHGITQNADRIDEPHILIRMGGSCFEDWRCTIPDNEQRLDVLEVETDDIDKETDDLILFTAGQANEIISFVNKYEERISCVVIHCYAGECRSPAVAAALSYMLNGDDSWIFSDTQYKPNMHIYRTMMVAIVGEPADLSWWLEHYDIATAD
ncbi:MAG: hypothetical protein GY861_21220 [bacterium]|nr:hypothetical protein [bacterium]